MAARGGGGGGGGAGGDAVVAMEDSVQALVEHLVQPLLPGRVSSPAPPTVDQQESVARQMHSVVLLYNYYHRKQFPQLEFLGFRSFCKEATIAKPSLVIYMKFMHKNVEESQDLDKDLSIMEKKIMDACNISSSLDASKNAPNMEGWPVSQVAVFLVDAQKEKCFLEFGSMTQGSWSLVEKELDKPIANLVNGIKMKKQASKYKSFSCEYSDGTLENEDSLQQLAFSAVEQKTGMSCSKLCILERHLTYSLSQDKTTTRLYIMKSIKVMNEGLVEFPIKDVLSSSRGPLIRTGLTPEVTSVVEYYHLLPYVNILSDWFLRKAPHDVSLDLLRRLPDVNECSLESDTVLTMEDHGINDSSDQVEQIVATSSNNINKTANEFMSKMGSNSYSRNDLLRDDCRPQVNVVSLLADPDMLPTIKDRTVYDKSTINANKNRMKFADVSDNVISEPCRNGPSLAISNPCKLGNKASLNQFQQPSPRREDVSSRKVIITDTSLSKRGSNDIHSSPDGPDDACTYKKDVHNLAKKPRTTESNDRETFGRKDTNRTFQDAVSSFDLPLVPVQLTSENNDEFNFVMTSKKNDLLRASLQILQKRRDDLVQQQRHLEDEIAQCEMNIQEILIGQGTMKSKVESMIEACNALCSSQMHMATSICSEVRGQPQEIKIKRLSEAILRSKSSCQELDDICCENGWILPKYSVVPSTADGNFQASVTVRGIDFETTVRGDSKSSSYEARLSAASNMLSKIRSMVEQQTLG